MNLNYNLFAIWSAQNWILITEATLAFFCAIKHMKGNTTWNQINVYFSYKNLRRILSYYLFILNYLLGTWVAKQLVSALASHDKDR